MEEYLDSVLAVVEDNNQVISGLEAELVDFKNAAIPVMEYVAPDPEEGHVIVPDHRMLLECLRGAPTEMMAREWETTRSCTSRSLSVLHLHYPLDMDRITMGSSSGV